MSNTTFVIAEIGVNHNGDLDTAYRLIDIALEAGADSAKFQTFSADTIVAVGTESVAYQKRGGSVDQYELLKSLELSMDHHRAIVDYCNAAGIEFMSTAFDPASMDLLIDLGVKRLKIPSGEITNTPLVQKAARTALPLIVSTGMAEMAEVAETIDDIRAARDGKSMSDVTVLHCTSSYPAPPSDINLRAMTSMAEEFGLPVGYSDHTEGIWMAPLAVAAGATMIEKHITLDRTMKGPDHAASIEPAELKQMIEDIRRAEIIRGDGVKTPMASELEARKLVRKGIKFSRDLPTGHVLSEADVVILRPDTGLAPRMLPSIVGRQLSKNVSALSPISVKDLD
ncbi:N-acetylneuraminate synthase [Hoeflea sp.]|uniref:N-acetylneuraminate synthase n=1 Tax=Hoeflea sp. TaxID=1940281 RepID=UPI00374A1226